MFHNDPSWRTFIIEFPPDAPLLFTREDLDLFLRREYQRTYKRPSSGDLHHLCPPPDDGTPCADCEEYWAEMVRRGWYILGCGWTDAAFEVPPPTPKSSVPKGSSSIQTLMEELKARFSNVR